MPDGDAAAALYDTTQEAMDAAGLPAYEIANHARPGAASRHNLTYWRSGDYVGIGPGAHGRVTDRAATLAVRRIRSPERWLAAVERGGVGTEECVAVAPDDRVAEVLMMGLRLAEGVPADRFRARTGRAIGEALEPARLAPLIEGGLLECDAAGLRASAAGRRVLNAVIAALLA